VTHLDTTNTPYLSEILTALLRAARICGVRAIRNRSFGQSAAGATVQRQAASLEALCQVRMLRTFSRQFLQRTKRAGLLAPDGVVGVIETGAVDTPDEIADHSPGYSSLLCQTLASLPEEPGSSSVTRVLRHRLRAPARACSILATRSASADFRRTAPLLGGAKNPGHQLS